MGRGRGKFDSNEAAKLSRGVTDESFSVKKIRSVGNDAESSASAAGFNRRYFVTLGVRALTKNVTKWKEERVRIDGDKSSRDPDVVAVFERQVARWGTTLRPYEIYARRPSIFRAVIGMWEGLSTSGLLDQRLKALINRRVAALNGCLF